MSVKAKTAVERFRNGLNCSQSVFVTFADELSIDKEIAFKIASGFGAGMGREQETCGAVSGAVMVLGLMNTVPGRTLNENKEASYAAVSRFISTFKKQFGSILCRDILDGCDLKTEEGQKQFTEQELLDKRCVHCVELAVNLLESIKHDQ
ncbi:MAG: C_GCAxxG_C_C family protein [Calditrichaceae bacterium]|nr:C_GCAxxG_C_C family protein [Calditrichaceae bacterium]MBN2709651.1 C_GCAxxG_C_C family protein [Calditrichaceae bacterium]RQV92446.1 MAG: C_GCAxxG_C_C family protein [Calditrichota bacterium]